MTQQIAPKRYREQGATALIVVVFSVLLITTITVGFLRLIIQDQARTTDDELSRGAYDSALAGVEDGKRVLQAATTGNSSAQNAIDDGKCNTIRRSGILGTVDKTDNSEVMLTSGSASSDSSTSFDQAYTCVKIATTTTTYQNQLDTDKSDVIPLNATGDFDKITIAWHLQGDGTVGGLTNATTLLPQFENWSSATGKVRPALLQVQLIQFNKTNVSAAALDDAAGSATLFLYPTSLPGTPSLSFVTDGRMGNRDLLQPVSCSASAIDYACTTTITLPNPPNGGRSDRQAYLRVMPLYAAHTSFKISLNDGAVKFNNVEPTIDSTGRASNVFRRVSARVKHTSTSFEYPRATVDTTNSLCKNFGVTGSAYVPGAISACNNLIK